MSSNNVSNYLSSKLKHLKILSNINNEYNKNIKASKNEKSYINNDFAGTNTITNHVNIMKNENELLNSNENNSHFESVYDIKIYNDKDNKKTKVSNSKNNIKSLKLSNNKLTNLQTEKSLSFSSSSITNESINKNNNNNYFREVNNMTNEGNLQDYLFKNDDNESLFNNTNNYEKNKINSENFNFNKEDIISNSNKNYNSLYNETDVKYDKDNSNDNLYNYLKNYDYEPYQSVNSDKNKLYTGSKNNKENLLQSNNNLINKSNKMPVTNNTLIIDDDEEFKTKTCNNDKDKDKLNENNHNEENFIYNTNSVEMLHNNKYNIKGYNKSNQILKKEIPINMPLVLNKYNEIICNKNQVVISNKEENSIKNTCQKDLNNKFNNKSNYKPYISTNNSNNNNSIYKKRSYNLKSSNNSLKKISTNSLNPMILKEQDNNNINSNNIKNQISINNCDNFYITAKLSSIKLTKENKVSILINSDEYSINKAYNSAFNDGYIKAKQEMYNVIKQEIVTNYLKKFSNLCIICSKINNFMLKSNYNLSNKKNNKFDNENIKIESYSFYNIINEDSNLINNILKKKYNIYKASPFRKLKDIIIDKIEKYNKIISNKDLNFSIIPDLYHIKKLKKIEIAKSLKIEVKTFNINNKRNCKIFKNLIQTNINIEINIKSLNQTINNCLNCKEFIKINGINGKSNLNNNNNTTNTSLSYNHSLAQSDLTKADIKLLEDNNIKYLTQMQLYKERIIKIDLEKQLELERKIKEIKEVFESEKNKLINEFKEKEEYFKSNENKLLTNASNNNNIDNNDSIIPEMLNPDTTFKVFINFINNVANETNLYINYIDENIIKKLSNFLNYCIDYKSIQEKYKINNASDINKSRSKDKSVLLNLNNEKYTELVPKTNTNKNNKTMYIGDYKMPNTNKLNKNNQNNPILNIEIDDELNLTLKKNNYQNLKTPIYNNYKEYSNSPKFLDERNLQNKGLEKISIKNTTNLNKTDDINNIDYKKNTITPKNILNNRFKEKFLIKDSESNIANKIKNNKDIDKNNSITNISNSNYLNDNNNYELSSNIQTNESLVKSTITNSYKREMSCYNIKDKISKISYLSSNNHKNINSNVNYVLNNNMINDNLKHKKSPKSNANEYYHNNSNSQNKMEYSNKTTNNLNKHYNIKSNFSDNFKSELDKSLKSKVIIDANNNRGSKLGNEIYNYGYTDSQYINKENNVNNNIPKPYPFSNNNIHQNFTNKTNEKKSTAIDYKDNQSKSPLICKNIIKYKLKDSNNITSINNSTKKVKINAKDNNTFTKNYMPVGYNNNIIHNNNNNILLKYKNIINKIN